VTGGVGKMFRRKNFCAPRVSNEIHAEAAMVTIKRIAPCLWFDDQAEEAAKYYTGIFRNSRIATISRYPDAGREIHGKAPGGVLTVLFELDGQPFTALNGGPQFKFNQAVSLQVNCAGQEEVDYYWDKLRAGGDVTAQACGWLKDKFGLSWQVVPTVLPEMIADPDPNKARRVFEVMLKMKKLDIAKLKKAYDG
jgi:predicted 3-demethylubiquinone-9 3-methyltransferase (glyoxalase superfamily)